MFTLASRAFGLLIGVWHWSLSYAYWYCRPLIKGILRRTTKLCELQRICYGIPRGAARAREVEKSLEASRTRTVQALIGQLDQYCYQFKLQGANGNEIIHFSAGALVKIKQINISSHKIFVDQMAICLAQIFGYRQLVQEVETVRKIAYSSENPVHEEKLLQLWNHLMPTTPLYTRVTKQWGDIGFQGDDPKTDFRGMGLLGLENLLYFSTEYTAASRHVLSHSLHPTYGYSFAIVGINLTSLAFELLLDGTLKTHMWNVVNGRPSIKHFHEAYCYLFYMFDKYWLEKKPNIMEFNKIKDEFRISLKTILQNPNMVLKVRLVVDTV